MNSHQFEPAMTWRSLQVALAVSIALVWSTQSGTALRATLDANALTAIPYLRAALASLSDVLVMVGLCTVAARRSPISILTFSGMGLPRLIHLAWALGTFAPALAICIWMAPLADPLDAEAFVWPGVLGPALEELVYRGLAVGVLMRVCGWPLAAACLWPAVFFGLTHIWQGSGGAEVLGIVAITGLGGLLFGWLFVRWGFSLWPPIFLHMGMNSLWIAFDLGENAIGGLLGNVERVVVVVLAIALTLWLTRHRQA